MRDWYGCSLSEEEPKTFLWSLSYNALNFIYVEEWLDVWGNIVSSARNIHDLPMWLQYYPKERNINI